MIFIHRCSINRMITMTKLKREMDGVNMFNSAANRQYTLYIAQNSSRSWCPHLRQVTDVKTTIGFPGRPTGGASVVNERRLRGIILRGWFAAAFTAAADRRCCCCCCSWRQRVEAVTCGTCAVQCIGGSVYGQLGVSPPLRREKVNDSIQLVSIECEHRVWA